MSDRGGSSLPIFTSMTYSGVMTIKLQIPAARDTIFANRMFNTLARKRRASAPSSRRYRYKSQHRTKLAKCSN
jgi:hypothetical protein